MQRIPFVDLKAQYQAIKPEINEAIQHVMDSTAFIGGRAVLEFEGAFAKFCGAKYAVGVGNGTDALALALKALGVGPGDEVITVPNTFIATTEAISRVGADIVFVDVHPETYNMDFRQLEEKITRRTKAVIPVHLYGQPADMEPLLAIARKHGLKVLEDACQAHGATYKGRRVGSFGEIAAFSFYPSKNLGAYGDGGAVVTNDADLAEKVRMLGNHGSLVKYEHPMEGVNSRLDAIQAAILSAKLKHLEDWNCQRRKHAQLYNELLSGIDGVVTPKELSGTEPVYHLYVIQVEKRDALRAGLQEQGIETGIHYPMPLHLQPAYERLGLKKGAFPVSEQAAGRILSLPMYPELTEEMIERVVKAIQRAIA